MTLQIDFWQLLGFGFTLLSGFAAIVVGAGRLIATQFERRIDERFDAMAQERKREADGITTLERQFLRFQADLPLHYVRREDYVRGQAVMEAKQDALYNKLETIQAQMLKGPPHG